MGNRAINVETLIKIYITMLYFQFYYLRKVAYRSGKKTSCPRHTNSYYAITTGKYGDVDSVCCSVEGILWYDLIIQ